MFKGYVKEELESHGYNLKQRLAIYASTIGCTLAPIVAGKYLISSAMLDQNPITEAVSWGGSIILNSIPMVSEPHLPLPFYTGAFGAVVSCFSIKLSDLRKAKKESLENMANESSEKL